MNDFEQFLNTGRSKVLALGMAIDEIERVLGEPGAVSSSRNPRLYQFGQLQLGFFWDKHSNKRV
jgi:hypothetical protein